MDEMKGALPVLLAHFCIGLAGCLAYVLIRPVSAELIVPFVLGWRIRSGVLLFIGFIPALLISGILVGYALAFSKKADDLVERWSATLLVYLKGAFLVCLVCISLYVAFAEAVAPALVARNAEAVARTDDYYDLIAVARQSAGRQDYADAEAQVSAALTIWPKSPDALALLDDVRYAHAEKTGRSPATAQPQGSRGNTAAEDSVLRSSEGMKVLEALDLARNAERDLDYFNMHYYATLAWKLAPGTDPNKEEAQRIASRAWNLIAEGKDLISAESDRKLYDAKRDGYTAIQNGDYLRAYYHFMALKEDERVASPDKKDTDVDRLLEISRKGVLESYFFIDETYNMKLFESSREIFFIIRRPNGATDSVCIRGITYARAAGKDQAYLRGFEYARFDADNQLRYQINVPYVKMFPFTSAGGRAQPELLLRAIDRGREGADVVPTVISGAVPDSERNILLLDMPWEDFNLIVTANRGPDSMSLLDLMSFAGKAEQYGFPRDLYMAEMIERLADPFLMLIMSVLALILGWKFKLGQRTLFKAWWVLIVPLFPLLSLYAIETVRYLARLCIVVSLSLQQEYPLPLMLGFLALLFAGLSVYFFAQRSD